MSTHKHDSDGVYGGCEGCEGRPASLGAATPPELATATSTIRTQTEQYDAPALGLTRSAGSPSPSTGEAEAQGIDPTAIKARRDQVMLLTHALAKNADRAFRMSIPVQPSDSDMLLMALCADVDHLLAALTLARQRADAKAQVVAAAELVVEAYSDIGPNCKAFENCVGDLRAALRASDPRGSA